MRKTKRNDENYFQEGSSHFAHLGELCKNDVILESLTDVFTHMKIFPHNSHRDHSQETQVPVDESSFRNRDAWNVHENRRAASMQLQAADASATRKQNEKIIDGPRKSVKKVTEINDYVNLR